MCAFSPKNWRPPPVADFISTLRTLNLGFIWIMVGLGLAYCLVLWRLGMFTPSSLKTTRQYARDREIGDFRPLTDKLAERSTLLRRFYNSINIRVLILVAGLKHNPAAWTFRTIAASLAVVTFFFGLDALSQATSGPTYPYVLSLVPGVAVGAIFYVRLRSTAMNRRNLIQTGLGTPLWSLLSSPITNVWSSPSCCPCSRAARKIRCSGHCSKTRTGSH